MKKVIRGGKVAILYSPGYGAGWSTWSTTEGLEFCPEVVKLVEEGRTEEITEEFMKTLGYDYVCSSSAVANLNILWLNEGALYYIEEYDGSERVLTQENFSKA